MRINLGLDIPHQNYHRPPSNPPSNLRPTSSHNPTDFYFSPSRFSIGAKVKSNPTRYTHLSQPCQHQIYKA